MHKDKTADKPTWAPNEAPASRWVGFFFAGFFSMTCIQLALMSIVDIWKMDGVWAWPPGTLCPLASFALTFACLAFLSKKICRTSVRDLVLGAGNGLDRMLCVKLCAADVVYRTPLAGCAIHWMNNFISIALFCQAGSAVESGSVFWATGAVSGPSSFVGTICLFVPVVAVMAVDVHKRKAAQAAEA